jgi:hypothetical protein
MKKIRLAVAGLLVSIHAFSQVASSETFGATVPKEASKLTRKQLVNILHDNYKWPAIQPNRENIYQLNGLLISYWGLSVNSDYHKNLEASQKEILGYLKRDELNTINESKIVVVNNIKFLVYEYQRGDEVYLRFQSDFDKNLKNVNGIIQFKKPDEEKAQKTLQDLLQSIHFKE